MGLPFETRYKLTQSPPPNILEILLESYISTKNSTQNHIVVQGFA